MNTETFSAKNSGKASGALSGLLNKYENQTVIGSGGMKIIMRAKDTDTKRDIAVAVAKNNNKHSYEQFIEEAYITAMLEHPNVVPVHEIGYTLTGVPYFTMKLISGETLAGILRKIKSGNQKVSQKFPLNRLLDIFLRVLDAIAFAHSKSILHLDLKPDNIQLGDYGEVLVIDWGLARTLKDVAKVHERPENFSDEKNAGKTFNGIVKGTPEYMAPEQALGQNSKRSERTDIYSLGAILYAILTRCAPVKGANADEIVQNVADGKITPFSTYKNLDIPEALQFVVFKAMARAPENRYQSVEELKNDIQAYLQNFPTQAEDAGFFMRLILFMRRRVPQLAAISITVFVFFILFIFFFMRLYYKQIELSIYENSERARIHAIMQKKRLENMLFRDNQRDWMPLHSDDFTVKGNKSLWHSDGKPLKSENSLGFELNSAEKTSVISFSKPFTKLSARCIINFTPINFGNGSILEYIQFKPDGTHNAAFRITGGNKPEIMLYSPESGQIFAKKQIKMIQGYPAEIDMRRIMLPDMSFRLEVHFNGVKIIETLNNSFFNTGFGYGMPEIKLSNASAVIKRITLFRLGLPAKFDISDLAKHSVFTGNFELAKQLFNEAKNGGKTQDRIIAMQQALELAENVRKAVPKLDEWTKQLKSIYKHSAVKMHIEGPGLALRIRGGVIMDTRFLKTLPVSTLIIENCRVTSLDFIKSMPVKRLVLNNTGTTSLQQLGGAQLKVFACRNNAANSLAALEQCVSLNRLEISNSYVSDLSPLEKLINLSELEISNSKVKDISPLKELQIEKLNISGNEISDISPLQNMPLQSLDCSGNKIKSLAPIAGKQFTILNVARNAISDAATFYGITAELLDCSQNKLEEFPKFNSMNAIRFLNCSENKIKIAAMLNDAQNLETLDISGNELSSAGEIAALASLTTLNISDNMLSSFAELSGLYKLSNLNIAGNPAASLEPLDGLNLFSLNAIKCPLTNFGSLLRFPPGSSMLINSPNLTDEKISHLIQHSFACSQTLAALSAYRNGNYQALKKFSFNVNGKSFTLIPILVNYSDARQSASKAGGHLPAVKTQTEAAALLAHTGTDVWLNSTGKQAPQLLSQTAINGYVRDGTMKNSKAALLIEWSY